MYRDGLSREWWNEMLEHAATLSDPRSVCGKGIIIDNMVRCNFGARRPRGNAKVLRIVVLIQRFRKTSILQRILAHILYDRHLFGK